MPYWYLVANFLDNLYDDDASESGSGWISWFCDLEGHEFFIEVSSNNLTFESRFYNEKYR